MSVLASHSANGYQAGWDKYVTFAGTRLNITQWEIDDGGDLVDITHTGHQGFQAWIPCIARVNGSVTANFTTAQVIWGSPGIRFGATGTITKQFGTSNPFTIAVIVEKVTSRSVVNGVVSYTFSYKSDAESGGGASCVSRAA